MLETLGIGRLRVSGFPKIESASTTEAPERPEPIGNLRGGAIGAAGQAEAGSENWGAQAAMSSERLWDLRKPGRSAAPAPLGAS